MARTKRVRCPECEDSFELESDLEIGDNTVCPNCYVELKLTELDPPVLKTSESELSGEEFDDDLDEDEVEEEDEEEEELNDEY